MVFKGSISAQTSDGEAGRSGVRGLLGRGGDEPVEVDEGSLNETRVVTGLPLRQLRGVHDLRLSASPLRQLPDLSAKFLGRYIAVMNENNAPRVGVANPRPDFGTGSHEDEGAGFRELNALGDDPLYRVFLGDFRRHLVSGPQVYIGTILQFVVEV